MPRVYDRPVAQGGLTILERLRAIQGQLQAAERASTHDEAFAMLKRIVNEYEDEHSGAPYAPEAARTTPDGRIYPPEPDSEKPSSEPGARRYRTRGHNVYIGLNGAIAFENVKSKAIEFSKPGADGQEVKK
jgi:hypothetical protein